MWPDNYSHPQEDSPHPEGELAAFALNALDDAEFQAVFHHVVQCPHCQEVLLGFQETSARLTGAAPEAPLPSGLRDRVLASVTGRVDQAAASLPQPDVRWSARRLRRWLAPAAIGTLSVLLALSIGLMAIQHQEINELTAAVEFERELLAEARADAPSQQAVAGAYRAGLAQETMDSGVSREQGVAAPAEAEAAVFAAARPAALAVDRIDQAQGSAVQSDAAWREPDDMIIKNAETVDQMKQEMAEVVEATVLSAQPETEKVPMSSPMGTEPQAKGVLMVEPDGKRGVLMVSGMPADTYQIWLMRNNHQVLVDRVVVNDEDGAGVQPIELNESIFRFDQVALRPDERHGPTNPTGEQFLTALIIQGPPQPPR